jgi:hypothetical protein
MKAMRTAVILAIVCLLLGKESFAGSQSYYWYEGKQKKSLFISPRLMAEFFPGQTADSAVKKEYPSAALHSAPGPFVRIWQLDNHTPPTAAALHMKRTLVNKSYSPIFTDLAQSGHRRALPGGIVVTLKPDWKDDQVKSWLTQNKLTVVRQMDGMPNVFVIQTGPGLEALQKANGLMESGEVVAAEPNWWQEMALK